jgi:hypothetical protein
MIIPFDHAKLDHKLEVFADAIPNARLLQTVKATQILTDVEFRMWLNKSKLYDSFDPSHFEGLEAQFVKTGTWDWIETDK